MLKRYIDIHPAMLTVILTFLSVGLLFIAKAFEPTPEPLFNWPRVFLLMCICYAVVRVLKKFNWNKEAGLTLPISSWTGRWYLASIPLLLIALLSSTSANWPEVEFSAMRVSAWLLSNISGSFFEELLLRGLCFYILLRAWGNTKKGVYLAALFQALIFGLAHLANLYFMPAIDVIAQVIFATLIGIGFAGLVYLSKSLWPAIIVHSLINLAGTINDFLVPGGSEFQSPGVSGYVVIIAIFLVLSTIPGLFYLRASTKHLTTRNS